MLAPVNMLHTAVVAVTTHVYIQLSPSLHRRRAGDGEHAAHCRCNRYYSMQPLLQQQATMLRIAVVALTTHVYVPCLRVARSVSISLCLFLSLSICLWIVHIYKW